jgi:hypothetical protein
MHHQDPIKRSPVVHLAAGMIVDHALRITAGQGFAPSALLDLAISFVDFSPLHTK